MEFLKIIVLEYANLVLKIAFPVKVLVYAGQMDAKLIIYIIILTGI